MADYSTKVDIPCLSGDPITASISTVDNGASALFSTGNVAPSGCTVTSEEISFVIDGESFGPFASLPATLGPLAGGTYAGTSFTLVGTISSFTITPDSGYIGNILVTATYEVEGDICGTANVSGSVNLDWTAPVANFTQTDNGGGNIVFDSATSVDSSCPSGITGYLWTVYASDGTTVLNAPADYTLNSANLTSATLDIDLPVGDYVTELEVTTDCGVNSTTQNVQVILLPLRNFTGTDDSDLNAVTVTTGGSQDAAGGNIENDPTASYVDEFKGPNSEQLFSVDYVGNGGVSLSGFNALLSPADQTALSALFTGNGGAAGYTFDKEAAHDILFAAGVFADGGEWEICGTVTHGGATSAIEDEIIATEFALTENLALTPGNTGPTNLLNTVRIGLARGYRNGAGFSYLLSGSNMTSIKTDYEGSVPTGYGITDPMQSQAASSINNLSIEDFSVPVNSGVQGESLDTGLFAYSTQWLEYEDNNPGSTPATPSNIRILPTADNYASINPTTGLVNLNVRFDNSGAGGVFGETVTTSTFDAKRFGFGNGGITVTGVNDANNATTPQTAAIAGGSLQTYPVTNPSNLSQQFTADAGGDYFSQVDVVTSGGNNLQFISSVRVKKY